MATFDHLLEFHETLKWNADREFDALLVQSGDDFVAEEGAVHPHLNDHAWQNVTHLLHAFEDEIMRAVGIMNVARAV